MSGIVYFALKPALVVVCNLILDIRKIQMVTLCLNIAAQTAIHRLFLTRYHGNNSRAPRARLLSTQAPRRLFICYLPNFGWLHYRYCILFGFVRYL